MARRRTKTAPPGEAPRAEFYAGQFKPAELNDLEAALQPGLEHEIAMLRVATRRVFELSGKLENLDEAISALSALGLASGRLSTLLRRQAELQNKRQTAMDAISRALHETLQEMKLL